MRRKIIHKMGKNYLTEGKICAVAALHARVFGVRRAATNEGVFTPQLAFYVLRSNCPSLPVKLDYPSAYRCTHAFSRHFRRIAVTRQRADTTADARLVRGGRQCIAVGDAQTGHRRYAGSTSIRESAGQHHSARSCKEEQQAAVSAGAMLGYVGRQRAGQRGQETCVADCVPFSSRHWQSQQGNYCAGVSAQSGSGEDEQARAAAVRCLVHAGEADIAAAVAKDANHRPSALRCRIIHAARRVIQVSTWTTQNLRDQNDTRMRCGIYH